MWWWNITPAPKKQQQEKRRSEGVVVVFKHNFFLQCLHFSSFLVFWPLFFPLLLCCFLWTFLPSAQASHTVIPSRCCSDMNEPQTSQCIIILLSQRKKERKKKKEQEKCRIPGQTEDAEHTRKGQSYRKRKEEELSKLAAEKAKQKRKADETRVEGKVLNEALISVRVLSSIAWVLSFFPCWWLLHENGGVWSLVVRRLSSSFLFLLLLCTRGFLRWRRRDDERATTILLGFFSFLCCCCCLWSIVSSTTNISIENKSTVLASFLSSSSCGEVGDMHGWKIAQEEEEDDGGGKKKKGGKGYFLYYIHTHVNGEEKKKKKRWKSVTSLMEEIDGGGRERRRKKGSENGLSSAWLEPNWFFFSPTTHRLNLRSSSSFLSSSSPRSLLCCAFSPRWFVVCFLLSLSFFLPPLESLYVRTQTRCCVRLTVRTQHTHMLVVVVEQTNCPIKKKHWKGHLKQLWLCCSFSEWKGFEWKHSSHTNHVWLMWNMPWFLWGTKY